MFRVRPCALAVGALFAAVSQAQTNPPAARLPEVVVTANPLGSDLFELASPASVLQGNELVFRRRSTLGETLGGLPGVSSSYFGPNASRPVIRGIDGDRIRILQNGVTVLDASGASFDHAVPVEPLALDRVEVVRGPAALLYGGSAVGGVVNVIDNRIPQSPLRGFSGAAELRLGGADRERGLGAMLEGGNGRFALHADVSARETSDLKIPGFARSARLRASGQPAATGFEPHGSLPNSAARGDGGAIGASATWADGFAGLSYSRYESNYGTVAEPTVKIDMESSRWDFAGEARGLGKAISAVKFKLGYTDYKHAELDAGVVGTTFKNRGYDSRIEFTHGNIGPLRGAFGIQLTDNDFSALGDEAFVPQTNSDVKGLFVFEELPLGALKLTFGGRYERAQVSSQGGGSVDVSLGGPRFGAARSASFDARSGAFGAVYELRKGLSLAANLAYTERAPTHTELYANGPHAATGAYEVGNAAFGKEKSKAFDLGLRMRSGAHSGSVAAFVTRYDNFITLFGTGRTRGADGEINPVDVAPADGVADGSGEEIASEFVYRAVPARFHGIEAEGRFRLLDRGGTLDLIARFDLVRATDLSTGAPIPRIAPMRLGLGLDWTKSGFGANAEVVFADGQDRVAAGELPTSGYTLLNAGLSYRFKSGPAQWLAFLRANNLLDREARNHASFLAQIAPLPGRSLMAGVRGSF